MRRVASSKWSHPLHVELLTPYCATVVKRSQELPFPVGADHDRHRPCTRRCDVGHPAVRHLAVRDRKPASHASLGDPHGARDRAVDGGARHDRREHRAAVGAEGAGIFDRRPAMGRYRVRPRVRQPVAARWPARRPARPQARLHHRTHRLRGSFGDRRRGERVRHAGHRAGRARGLRSDARAGRPRAAHDHIHPIERARESVRNLRRDRRWRRCGRAAARRRAHRIPVVALVHVREPGLRDRRGYRWHGALAQPAF